MDAKKNLHPIRKAQRGFTIVELVGVIAVLAILIAIFVPTFSNMDEFAKQRALKMDLETAYTSFASDCSFRKETCMAMSSYTFVHKDAISYTAPSSGSAPVVKIKADGYRWNGDEDVDVTTVKAADIKPTSTTVVYGPFNNYYLLAFNQAHNWAGEGTATNPYLVKNYRDLRAIAEHVARGETLSGKYFELTSDIVINNESWLPIGGFYAPTAPDTSGKIVFSGNFNGMCHTISIAYGRVDMDSYCLFGKTKNATIHDLIVSGTLDIGKYAGGIVAVAEGSTKIINCQNKADVAGRSHAGGIVGYLTGTSTISNCYNEGQINCYTQTTNGHDNAIGGIAGEATASTTIENTMNSSIVQGMGGAVGGIVGIGRGVVRHCHNQGEVISKSFSAQHISASGNRDSLVGGIIGWGADTGSVESSSNSATVYGVNNAVGGVVGADASVRNSINHNTVTAAGDVGGIVGVLTNSGCTIENVHSRGNVIGKTAGSVGGVVGRLTFSNAWTLNVALCSGSVQFRKDVSGVTNAEAGLFIGSAKGKVTLKGAFLAVNNNLFIGTAAGTNTAVGKSASTTGTATVQTNQDTLLTALNNAVSGTTLNSWVASTYFLKPIEEHGISFALANTSHIPHDRMPDTIDNAFLGIDALYAPYMSPSVIYYNGYANTFKGWRFDGVLYAPGDRIPITKDTTLVAEWERTVHEMKPVPFE